MIGSFAVGSALKAAGGFLKAIPWPVYLAAGILLAGWWWGEQRYDAGEIAERGRLQPQIDALENDVSGFRKAQATNLGTIDKLEAALAKWEALANSKSAAAAAAARQAQADREALEAHLKQRQDERQVIYDRDPDARQWGATRVPSGLANQLQD